MAFTRKKIQATFKLSQGGFTGQNGADTVLVKDLRVSLKISKAGTTYMVGTLMIYGMALSTMNKLTTLGYKSNLLERNLINVEAGDTEKGLSTVIAGTVMTAWVNLKAAPEGVFEVTIQSGGAEALIAAEASSFQGSADIDTIMSGFANKMSLGFENSGVTGKLSNPYFPGTLMEQAKKCARDGGFEFANDDGKLLIWPKDGARGDKVPLISPRTVLKGYPAYTAFGISLETHYDPSITFGSKIKVESQLEPANGTWYIYEMSHDLESEVTDGAWFSTISAIRPDTPTPLR